MASKELTVWVAVERGRPIKTFHYGRGVDCDMIELFLTQEDAEAEMIDCTIQRATLVLDESKGRKAVSEHTNCWCASDVIRCGIPDCPRQPRYFAEQEKQRKHRKWLDELLDRAKNHVMTEEEIAAQRASWGRQMKD